MLKELGFTSGIENYSRILDGRPPGSPPHTLIDYFPDDFVCFVDESHQTIPQIGGMYEGDQSRKRSLVDYGFRLPSAMDNRPLKFDEFLARINQLVMVSATPGPFERAEASRTVEQIVRPTGIVDPEIEVRETKNQIDDLMNEIKRRTEASERVLVTTLTKKMAEDLTGYLLEYGIKVRYLHSEVDTLERIQIIRDLRLGEYDVLVGVNLLREGLDLPEVSLVAILDADKEGFLRGETSLIQTIGRAARNVDGTGADVRRQGDRRDARRDRRDRPPPRDPARLQRGARDHPGDGAQGDLRDDRVPGDGGPRPGAPPAPRPRRRLRRAGGAGAHDRLPRGGDDRRRRGPPLRGGGADPRRDQGAAPRPRRDPRRDLSSGARVVAMDQRLSLVTLGVADLGRSRAFYEALGWHTNADPGDDVVFFQAGGMVVALWDRARLAEDSGVEDSGRLGRGHPRLQRALAGRGGFGDRGGAGGGRRDRPRAR